LLAQGKSQYRVDSKSIPTPGVTGVAAVAPPEATSSTSPNTQKSPHFDAGVGNSEPFSMFFRHPCMIHFCRA
jgi:hypothetical protein